MISVNSSSWGMEELTAKVTEASIRGITETRAWLLGESRCCMTRGLSGYPDRVGRPSITYDGLALHPSRPPMSRGLSTTDVSKARCRDGRGCTHRNHPRTRLVTFFVLSSVLVSHSSAGRSGIVADAPLLSLTHDCNLEFCPDSRVLFFWDFC